MKINIAILIITTLHQIWTTDAQSMPNPRELCRFIVDSFLKKECLQCFRDTMPLSADPEGVRGCVATYLPPDMANCAVPHARRSATGRKMVHHSPNFHETHVNANLLPSCLSRALKRLKEYVQSEVHFYDTSKEVFMKLTSKQYELVQNGGLYMLQVAAQRQILKEIEDHFSIPITPCPDTLSLPELSKTEGYGNNLPLSGLGPIAKELIDGHCIIHSLIENGHGEKILDLIASEDFYSPIPKSWVLPLLQHAQKHESVIMN